MEGRASDDRHPLPAAQPKTRTHDDPSPQQEQKLQRWLLSPSKGIMASQYRTPQFTLDVLGGASYAYWRYGKENTVPLVFVRPFWGNEDAWYPTLIQEIAVEREVILFDPSGLGSSVGEVPSSFRDLGTDTLAFIDALRLPEVDLFDSSGVGRSSGELPPAFRTFGEDAVAFFDVNALVDQELFDLSSDGFLAPGLAFERPQLVRRVVLAFLSPYPHDFSGEVNHFLSRGSGRRRVLGGSLGQSVKRA